MGGSFFNNLSAMRPALGSGKPTAKTLRVKCIASRGLIIIARDAPKVKCQKNGCSGGDTMSWMNWDRYPWIVVDVTEGKFINGFTDFDAACRWASVYRRDKGKGHTVTVLEYPTATMA